MFQASAMHILEVKEKENYNILEVKMMNIFLFTYHHIPNTSVFHSLIIIFVLISWFTFNWYGINFTPTTTKQILSKPLFERPWIYYSCFKVRYCTLLSPPMSKITIIWLITYVYFLFECVGFCQPMQEILDYL